MKTITTQNLAESTEQEVFEFIAHHLLTQKVKSRVDEIGCLYRSPEGLSCAAGCLLTDVEAKKADRCDPSGENGTNWIQVVRMNIVTSVHANLITELQQIHDHHCPTYWSDELRELAEARKLNTAIIDSFTS